jgi:GrpB-like predicted nucleotidyltransferase (UPF0157 family)
VKGCIFCTPGGNFPLTFSSGREEALREKIEVCTDYIHEGNLGIQDREAFKYNDKPHLQRHHLYVCPQYSEELRRHMTFRDFLRSNRQAVERYSRVKEKAAELFSDDIDGYIAYKSPCIEELYRISGLDE